MKRSLIVAYRFESDHRDRLYIDRSKQLYFQRKLCILLHQTSQWKWFRKVDTLCICRHWQLCRFHSRGILLKMRFDLQHNFRIQLLGQIFEFHPLGTFWVQLNQPNWWPLYKFRYSHLYQDILNSTSLHWPFWTISLAAHSRQTRSFKYFQNVSLKSCLINGTKSNTWSTITWKGQRWPAMVRGFLERINLKLFLIWLRKNIWIFIARDTLIVDFNFVCITIRTTRRCGYLIHCTALAYPWIFNRNRKEFCLVAIVANQKRLFPIRSWIFVTNLSIGTIVTNIVLYNLIHITVIAFSSAICTSFDILIEWTCCTSVIFHDFQGCTINASTGCIWYLIDCTCNTLTCIGTVLFEFKMIHPMTWMFNVGI